MSDAVNKPLPEDEFDVEVFAKKIYALWKAILGKLMYPFVLLFHKPLRLLIAAVLTFGIATSLRYTLPQMYESKMYIVPVNRGDLNALNLIYDLQELSENSDHAMLASMLGLDEANARAVKSIKAKAIWRNRTTDTISLIEVSVRASQPGVFANVQGGLLAYLENNEHYARIKLLRVQEIKAMQDKLSQEMTEIDSLKNQLLRSMTPRSAGGFVYGEPLDPVRVYDTGLNLYKQRASLIWQENYVNNFEVVKPFVVGSKPGWPKFSYLLLFSAIGTTIILLIYNHRDRSKAGVMA